MKKGTARAPFSGLDCLAQQKIKVVPAIDLQHMVLVQLGVAVSDVHHRHSTRIEVSLHGLRPAFGAVA
jgi:hypothetical protein